MNNISHFSLPPGPAAASLAAVRKAARQRRWRRRAGRTALASALILTGIHFSLPRPGPQVVQSSLPAAAPRERGHLQAAAPAPLFVTVRTQAQPLTAQPASLPAFVSITTVRTSPAGFIPAQPVLISTATSPPVVPAQDEDLLAGAGNRPVALCRLADGVVRWLPLDSLLHPDAKGPSPSSP